MDARQFFGLDPAGDTDSAGSPAGFGGGGDRLHWRLTVRPELATPGTFLFGGCGLGAGLVALEAVTGRPTVWASAQYLSYATVGHAVDYEVVVATTGRHITQARAVARSDGREILTVNAALGMPQGTLRDTWVRPPDVPPPDRCPPRQLPPQFANTILDAVEVRLALGRGMDQLDGTPGPPDSAFWARVPGHLSPSAATLAIFGDYVSGGASQPLGRRTMGRSLDNTLRIVRLVPTEWVLCDIRMHAIHDDYAQGTAFLWSDRGVLLGTASQSLSVRFRPPQTTADGAAPGG
ncbi:MAG TPA: acyl-CoA thioesterase domain-containing protein [Acidimicrobiales bacterium]|nr:acyl-CoA thioesterase domain-containing protein [Acidimicrobiales bacterium]